MTYTVLPPGIRNGVIRAPAEGTAEVPFSSDFQTASVIFAFSLIPVVLVVVGGSIMVVLRRRRDSEGGNALRFSLLAAAAVLFFFGTIQMSQPAANDPTGQCGSSAADAADLPASATADANGPNCQTLGRQQMRGAYIFMGLSLALAIGVVATTRRPENAG
jgi:hypothetical protein